MFLELAERSKFVMATVLYVMFSGWLNQLRDGPLDKLWGRGIFEPQEFFFVIKFLV